MYSVKQILQTIPGAIMLILLTACSTVPSVHVTQVSDRRYPPTGMVRTFRHAPKQSYTVIADLALTGRPGQSPAQMLAELLKEAGNLGANALWITSEIARTPQNGPMIYNPSGGNYVIQFPEKIIELRAKALYING